MTNKCLMKILLCDINIQENKIIKQFEVLAKKSDEEIRTLLHKGMKKNDGKIMERNEILTVMKIYVLKCNA